jgi:hypothetical protein
LGITDARGPTTIQVGSNTTRRRQSKRKSAYSKPDNGGEVYKRPRKTQKKDFIMGARGVDLWNLELNDKNEVVRLGARRGKHQYSSASSWRQQAEIQGIPDQTKKILVASASVPNAKKQVRLLTIPKKTPPV